MKKRWIGILLAFLMLLSSVGTGVAALVPSAAVAATDESTVRQEIVQGGAILHCFDWSYNEIRANLADIEAAGYVAVQTSPVQPAKDYNGAWTDTGGNWWKLYQPLDFCVAEADQTWLGSKAELTALCTEAHARGISVIVDVVANHVANKSDGGYTVGGTYNVSTQVAERLQDPNDSKHLYHTSENGTNDNSRYNMTQYHLKMPDLNTGNQDVQDMVLDFLKECVDCGVDGFRFDAAKHIELPNDEGCASNFWPYVIGGVRDYADGEYNKNLYIYGESLSGNNGDTWVDTFTNLMALTDSQYGDRMREALDQTDAGKLGDGNYVRCGVARGNVVWVESHDTFETDNEDENSSGIASDKIVKAWAIVGARANSTSLYLARPNERMGEASTDTAWKSTAVAEVNKFKNYYDGTGEYLSSDYNKQVAWIERYGDATRNPGVVISKLDGAGWVELDAQLMNSGIYKDEVSGSNFAVSGGKITGYVGPTGVAVVYKTTTGDAPTPPEPSSQMLYLKPSSYWKQDGARFAVYTFGGGEHWYSMSLVNGETDVYGAEITNPYSQVIFCRMNPATTDNGWGSKWDQTGDLTVPSDKNLFIPTEGVWDGMTESWDVYGENGGTIPITVTEDEGYYLVGTMTGWSVLSEFKMTRTGASTEEYTIDVPLLRTSKPFHSQFKVVYSPDGVTALTWYPGGEKNNYGDYYDEDTQTGEIPQSGVYTVYFRPGYDGESGWHDNCIYAQRTKYFVTVNDEDKNGTVTVDKSVAAAGETVTVTVTPNEGYELASLVYLCETGFNTGTFTTTEIPGTTFTMPAENAAVKATFIEEGAVSLADGYYLVPDSDPTVENINPAHKLTLFTDLDQEGHVFNAYVNYAVTGNFGENTYRIVKVENNAIVPFDMNQEALTVTTTGATETVYFATEPAGQYTWINEYGTGVSSLSGYYLVIGNSPVPEITADYAFTETGTTGLYMLEKVLYHSSIFVCELENGRCIARYPAGSYMDSTQVAQNLDGNPFGWGSLYRLVCVSFRPDGQGTPVGTDYYGDYDKWFHGYFICEVLNRVIINESQHGTVTADKMTAAEGETVTLTITPDPGYELDTLTVVNDYNETIEVTDNAFEMTMWEAIVTATFKEAELCTVRFVSAVDGTDETEYLVLNVPSGTMLTPPATDPTRDGYYFIGWYERRADCEWQHTEDDGWKVYADWDEWYSLSDVVNSEMTEFMRKWNFSEDAVTQDTDLYAVWSDCNAKQYFPWIEAIPHEGGYVQMQIEADEWDEPNVGDTTDIAYAAPGDTVYFRVTPKEGYRYGNAAAFLNGETYELTITPYDGVDNVYSFTMPTDLSVYDDLKIEAYFEPVTAAEPTFVGQSLLLTGQIGLRFYMDLSNLTEDQKTGSYMTFTVEGANGSVRPLRAAFEDDPFVESHQAGGYYYFTCKVRPAQLATRIIATYHYGEGLSVSKTYSVEDYFVSADEHPTLLNEKDRAVVNTMADYGYYTQQYLSALGKITIGSAQYTEITRHYEDAYDLNAVKTAVESFAMVKTNNTNGDVEEISISLTLNDQPVINVYFKTAEGYQGDIVVRQGSTVLEGTTTENGYRVQITGVSAHLMGKTYTLTATTANGTATAKVSVLSYLYSLLNGEYTEEAGNWAAATYYYYQAAYARKYGN